MIKEIVSLYNKIVFLLSNASLRYSKILLNTNGDFEFISAINLCIGGHV